MKLLIKVLEHQFIDTVLTTEIIDSEVIIDEDINTFATAKFTMPLIDIEEYNIVEIYEVWNTDKRIFRGYVYKIEPVWRQFWIVNIECRSGKAIMNDRYALKTKSNYNITQIASLPSYPDWSPQFWVNYWVNESLTWLYFYKETVIPPPPEEWPAPSPYYTRWFTPFPWGTEGWTVWLVDTSNNEIKRLEDWQILDEGTGTGVDINWLLDDLIDDYSNDYNENWTYETDFTANVELNIQQWDCYFDILDELAKQLEATWTIQDKKIIFKRLAWTDRTTGSWYQEINYNWLFPNNANISSINVVWTATRSNIVLWQDQNNNILKAENYVDRIYSVSLENFRDWNLYNNTNQALTRLDKNQRIYEVQVEQNTIEADVWDKVKLIVENTNSFFDINSDVYVIWKNITYTNWSKVTNYRVWELNLDVINVQNRLYWVQKSVKLLKTK